MTRFNILLPQHAYYYYYCNTFSFFLFRVSTICAMCLDISIQEANSDITHQEWTISIHSFSDLTHVSPVVFLYLLKECYIRGTIFPTVDFIIHKFNSFALLIINKDNK